MQKRAIISLAIITVVSAISSPALSEIIALECSPKNKVDFLTARVFITVDTTSKSVTEVLENNSADGHRNRNLPEKFHNKIVYRYVNGKTGKFIISIENTSNIDENQIDKVTRDQIRDARNSQLNLEAYQNVSISADSIDFGVTANGQTVLTRVDRNTGEAKIGDDAKTAMECAARQKKF